MSTNVSFAGVSVKIAEENPSKETLKEIAGYLNYPEDELALFDVENDEYREILYQEKKNRWILYSDYNGEIGLIYLTEREYDVFDIGYRLSLEQINEIIGKLMDALPSNHITLQATDAKVFAYIYYNGTDNPFKF